MSEHPLKPLETLDESLFATVMAGGAGIYQSGALSEKHKLLIALAIDASKGAVGGVEHLGRLALQAGASKAEIADALRIVHYICGVGAMYTAAYGLKSVLE